MKKALTKAQIEDYKKLCESRDNGRLLTLDGLRFICENCNYDPEAIGRHFKQEYLDTTPHLTIILKAYYYAFNIDICYFYIAALYYNCKRI